ncbi:JAB domain-containing protein [uncultured Algoriphagus sp.]|uniref:JAB domain-containing protein n=1 Tax=uncultured Algoriphagus sp. TaxID=417365 RepID=UPI0030EC0FCF|tara:strand:- start:4871 stop:5329 length:459 start_codon:yes stop_codon:yes gene_type:complete
MSELDLFRVAEVELVYRSKVPASQRPKVKSSRDVYRLFIENWNQDKIEYLEEAKLLLLSRGSGVLGIYNLSSGGTAGTIVDPKLVFAAALKANASSIILAHNHPSGNLQPSEQDVRLTRRIREAGKLLDLELLDHLIVSKQGYYSFADECSL